MNNSWRSTPTGLPAYHDSTATTSPLTVRKKVTHDGVAIHPGTVASRVQYLQSLSNPSSANTRPPNEGRCRENLRTAFGRRLTNKFGLPVQQNNKPNEQTQIEASHSFTGLKTPRTRHEEGHAISDFRNRFGRSPGINGDLKPQGMMERTQYDAASPWSVFPRGTSCRNMEQEYKGPGRDVLREVDSTESTTQLHTQSSTFRSSDPEDDSRTLSSEHRSQQEGTVYSESSFATTSTIRRQSVRDLFADYGIVRPYGLASSRETSREVGPTPQAIRYHRCCHSCTWINGGTATKCWRCGHLFCSKCDGLSPMPISRKERSLDYVEKMPKGGQENSNPSPKPTKISHPSPKPNISPSHLPRLVRPGPTPIQPDGPIRKRSSVNKFPAYVEPTFSPEKGLEVIPDLNETSSILVPLLSGSQVTKNVKDSPFLIADLLSPSQPIRMSSMKMGVVTSHEHLIKKNSCISVVSVPDAANCESPGCRATHPGHQPFRHAATCTRSRENEQITCGTDTGYVADTSIDEDCPSFLPCPKLSRPIPRTECTISKSLPPAPKESRPTSRLSLCIKKKVSSQKCVPEFVECHGYPRTGHSRHGSPVSSGVVGECQHCLDDCQCAACRNTHHSVRCCVHADHQSIIHHHHTPRKSLTSAALPVGKPEPPKADSVRIETKSWSASAVPKAPRKETTRTVSTSSRKRPSLMLEPFSRQPSFPKSPTLPRSKTFKKQNSWTKPATPPPWIDNPKTGRPQGDLAKFDTDLVRNAIDTMLSAKPIEGPRPPFKDRQTLPPPATCDESSLEGAQEAHLNTVPVEQAEKPMKSSTISLPKLPRKQEDKGPMAAISRASSRPHISAPGSRRASRRLSALFALKPLSPVPLLNQKLQEHKDEVKRKERESSAGISHGAVERRISALEENAQVTEKTPASETVRPESQNSTKSEKKKWRLRLVGKKPSPACENDGYGFVEQHRLSDDEVIGEDRNYAIEKPAVQIQPATKQQSPRERSQAEQRPDGGTWIRLPPIDPQDHDCIWKSRFLEEQVTLAMQSWKRSNIFGDSRIRGVTVILQLEGREDMVFKASNVED